MSQKLMANTSIRIVMILMAIIAGGYGLRMISGGGQSPVQQTHVDAHVPLGGDFDRFLRRDLQEFFENEGSPLSRLEYDLLRKGATQAGVGYPKFYVWVRLARESGMKIEGAARASAQDKTKFRITHFFNREQIAADQSILDDVFPAAIANTIRDRLPQ